MYLNNSSHANATLQWTPRPPDHTVITLYSILLVWSLIGNVLVIAVVYCNQNMRTNMNYLIVNMAVSDLLIPLIAMPWLISCEIVRADEWLVEGPLGEALCKLVPFLSDISPTVSSINLVIIAFQRFIAVVYPTRRQILTRKTRWILICIPWIVAMALFSPYFYTYRLRNEWGYTSCFSSWSPAFEYWTAQKIFYSAVISLEFVIPLITIIIFYTIIQYKLQKSLKNVMEWIERKTILSRQRRNTRIFNMSITIIIVFTICWSPSSVLNLLLLFHHPLVMTMDFETLRKMHFAFIYLWCLFAAIDPCIYFLFLRDFRQGIIKIFSCRKAANEQTCTLCVCCANTVVTGGDQEPGRTPHVHHAPLIYTTTV